MISGLYAIADSQFDPSGSLPALACKFLKGGCRLVQLRMKGANPSDVFDAAGSIMSLKRDYDFTFIVNDFVDVAQGVGADGVHVGSNDETVESIKSRTGGELIVGYSAHSIEEAVDAGRRGADYVAFGAIYATRTKGPGHPVQGVERLKEVVASVDRPVVAIGGIDRMNVDGVLAAGAGSVAMITALAHAPDVTAETRWFVERINDFS